VSADQGIFPAAVPLFATHIQSGIFPKAAKEPVFVDGKKIFGFQRKSAPQIGIIKVDVRWRYAFYLLVFIR
jgi:hypothetical protein